MADGLYFIIEHNQRGPMLVLFFWMQVYYQFKSNTHS